MPTIRPKNNESAKLCSPALSCKLSSEHYKPISSISQPAPPTLSTTNNT